MKNLLILDFDGVVNALSKKGDRNVHPSWKSTSLLGHPILYAPRVVNFINNLSENDVDVVWCTSWEKDSSLFIDLGFNNFPYVTSDVNSLEAIRAGGWKANRGAEYASAYNNVVWFDDDYYVKREAKLPIVATNPNVGLSKKLLRNAGLDFNINSDVIDSWLV